MAAIAVALCSFCVGFTNGYTSPALPLMEDRSKTNFEVSQQAGSWIGGIMPLAGLVGGVCGGPLVMYVGRRLTILLTSVPFILSWLLIGFATSVWLVLSGRLIGGLAVGVSSLALPVYLGEALHPLVRGTLGLMPTLLGNLAHGLYSWHIHHLGPACFCGRRMLCALSHFNVICARNSTLVSFAWQTRKGREIVAVAAAQECGCEC